MCRFPGASCLSTWQLTWLVGWLSPWDDHRLCWNGQLRLSRGCLFSWRGEIWKCITDPTSAAPSACLSSGLGWYRVQRLSGHVYWGSRRKSSTEQITAAFFYIPGCCRGGYCFLKESDFKAGVEEKRLRVLRAGLEARGPGFLPQPCTGFWILPVCHCCFVCLSLAGKSYLTCFLNNNTSKYLVSTTWEHCANYVHYPTWSVQSTWCWYHYGPILQTGTLGHQS